jgi:hypothetical protein
MAKPSVGYEGWLVVFPRGNEGDMEYFKVGEKKDDGTITFWVFNMGDNGTLRPDVMTKPVTRKKERERVDQAKRGIQRGIERMDVQYSIEKARRSLTA